MGSDPTSLNAFDFRAIILGLRKVFMHNVTVGSELITSDARKIIVSSKFIFKELIFFKIYFNSNRIS